MGAAQESTTVMRVSRSDVPPAREPQLATDKRANVAEWFHRPAWTRAPLADAHANPASDNWLILEDEVGLGACVSEKLTAQGQTVVRVKPGTHLDVHNAQPWSIRPDNLDDHRALAEKLHDIGVAPNRVLHMWTVTSTDGVDLPRRDQEAQVALSFSSTLLLGSALVERFPGRSMSMHLVSTGMHRIEGNEPISPWKGVLTGPLKVLPKELPDITCQMLDLRTFDGQDAMVQAALAEAPQSFSGDVVAWRHGERFVQRTEPAALFPQPAGIPHVSSDAVWLITGGLGGIGLEVARWLADAPGAKLALIGRTALPPRETWARCLAESDIDPECAARIRAVTSLEAKGARVLVLAADVADRDDMTRALAKVREQLGHIDAVLHAAGVAGSETIEQLSEETVRSVLSPKVFAPGLLRELLADEPPEWVVLCSSINSWVGVAGSAAYTAANAALERWGDAWSSARTMVSSIAWDRWRAVGMARAGKLPVALQAELDRRAMTPDEGIECMHRLSSAPGGTWIVSTTPLSTRLFSAPSTQDAPTQPRKPGLEKAALWAPDDQVGRTVADVLAAALGVSAVGPGDDFFELGGHSLLAIEVASQLRRRLHVSISVHALLEHPKASDIASTIRRSMNPSPAVSQPSSSTAHAAAEPAVTNGSSLLVELKAGDPDVPPLFIFHPVGGTVFQYRALAKHLPGRVPVYGVRPMGVEPDEVLDDDVRVMAKRYLAAARRVHRTGRWRLGGHSFGGILAWEVAQQLQADGELVELLYLSDTPGPQEAPLELDDEQAIRTYLQEVGRGFWTQLQEGIATQSASTDEENSSLARYFNLFRTHSRAMYQYRAQPFDGGSVLYFKAIERDRFIVARPEVTWIDLCPRGIEIRLVPGNHITMALEPHIAVQGRILGAHLHK